MIVLPIGLWTALRLGWVGSPEGYGLGRAGPIAGPRIHLERLKQGLRSSVNPSSWRLGEARTVSDI